MDLTASVHRLIENAKAVRKLPPRSPERTAEILLQHEEMVTFLELLLLEYQGLNYRHKQLSSTVIALLSTLREVQPKLWRIRHHKLGGKFWARIADLADFLGYTGEESHPSEEEKSA